MNWIVFAAVFLKQTLREDVLALFFFLLAQKTTTIEHWFLILASLSSSRLDFSLLFILKPFSLRILTP